MNQCNENMPYIFISYSHRDSDLVLPIINRLRAEGYNVWYDAGIEAGSEWDENIANHIGGCSYFIAFVSKNYIGSKNCKDELNYSRDLDKEQFLIYLEEVELPGGMAMRMNRIQAIYWNQYMPNNIEAAYQKIFTAAGIEKNRVFMTNIGTYPQAQTAMPYPQPVMPHMQTKQVQPVMPHVQGAMNPATNAVSPKKNSGSLLKLVLIICGVLLVILLILAVVLGVVLIKNKTNAVGNSIVNSELPMGVDSNHPLYEYYQRAVDGDTDAMVYLGNAYSYGYDGVVVDYVEAQYWYEKAGEAGNLEGMWNAAIMYYEGYAVATDRYKRCVDWCTRMLEVDPGNADAMYIMGNCYYWGTYGVEEDPELAFSLWYGGAVRGHLDSIYNVVWSYEQGYGVEVDLEKAAEWNQILIDADYVY